MENSYDSSKWSDSTTPYMVSWSLQSESSDSDWSRFNLGFSSSSGNFPADDCVGGIEKAESLSRSHRQAEKRRRDRINSHLTALRKLVPNSDKLDKAALLATVIEQVKELKQKATESPIFQDLPTEADEVTVQPETISDFESNTNTIIFKASFCCEDQPEAISEIIRVLTKLNLETIQAEIICVGGRMRINFILKDNNCNETTNIAASAKALKQSLCAALNRITSSSSSTSSVCRIRSKRQRWFLSSHYSHNE
ncbi:Myc-type basic helix-loop-helix (bHLH) domain [Arabidopsis thaliana x Arabidopsis arenosa]|uniref:Myc-type basic helix-loop-helix (BHLH) domain n=1 Tax=Arabidopsis thaliana x Arabidopsis arenosa TaxID=1240361 RepID=A0A8T2A8M5_9BRAS|nr:Myc-type basic helix-loop-helix (bHLH) domain [Arabidopsis thaliana x Arabidopsis arenosa]